MTQENEHRNDYPESCIINWHVVCPNDTNPMSILKGGRLIDWMDLCAAICAQTFTSRVCVTASVDKLNFKLPVYVGEMVEIKAMVENVFRTSMNISVTARSRSIDGHSFKLVAHGRFRFVALDPEGKPTPVQSINHAQ